MASDVILACNGLFIPVESGMDSLFSVVGLSFLGAALTFSTTVLEDRMPIIHFASKPAVIAVRNEREDDHSGSNNRRIELEYKSLRELVESRCSSLFTEFRPLWYLFKYVVVLPTKY
jgi:uncharacterized protein